MLECSEGENGLDKAEMVSVNFNYIISISDSLLYVVGLKNLIVVTGMLDWFELWPYERWLEEKKKIDNRFQGR